MIAQMPDQNIPHIRERLNTAPNTCTSAGSRKCDRDTGTGTSSNPQWKRTHDLIRSFANARIVYVSVLLGCLSAPTLQLQRPYSDSSIPKYIPKYIRSYGNWAD
jgi:hypothetical protein